MNALIKAISELCNLQRDKHLRQMDVPKQKKRKETEFGGVLDQEQKKLKEVEDVNVSENGD